MQNPLPKTPEGEWLGNFIQAFNTGNYENIKRLSGGNEQAATNNASLYREFGPISYATTESGAYWFQGDITKGWVGLVLSERNNTFSIRGVRRGIRPADAPPQEHIALKEMPKYLDKYLRACEEGNYFSGTVLLAKDGKIVFKNAYGWADREEKVENKVDTRFFLASMAKTFVGVAIAKLAQEGKLSFQDPMSKFIPEYPKHIGDKVTVHHLLTHTSGIELDDHQPYMAAVAETTSLKDLLATQVKYIEHLNLGNYNNFEPLNRFDYTNEGIDLLGVVIERASGMDWREYIKKNVFQPTGMNNTGFMGQDVEMPILAKGYSERNETLDERIIGLRRPVDYGDPALGFMSRTARPAGGGYSTIEDMLNFVQALQNGQLLESEYFKTMISSKTEPMTLGSMKRSYGYTFDIQEQDGVTTVGHSGGAPGTSTYLNIYPEQGFVSIVLGNFDDSGALSISQHIRELIAAMK